MPAPSNGDHIIAYRFTVVGTHVYYEVANASFDRIAFYRAPLDGSSPPENLVDAAPFGVSVAPNERSLGWIERDQATAGWSLVTVDVPSGARRVYPLAQPADRITWSPTGPSAVVGWSPAFTTVTVQTDVCLKWSGGILGSSCLTWLAYEYRDCSDACAGVYIERV